MNHLWNTDDINPYWFKRTVKYKLLIASKQEWVDEIHNSNVCLNYRIFKKLETEKYLDVQDDKDRIALTKFRCGNNRLPITTGRFTNLPRNQRICTLCNSHEIGDEYHYIFQCKFL